MWNRLKKIRGVRSNYLVMLVLTVILAGPFPAAGDAITDQTYQMLDEIRDAKKQQLLYYLEALRQKAHAIRSDTPMRAFFHLKNKYYELKKKQALSDEVSQRIEALKKNINEHYLKKYLMFHDILFINNKGDIFYTIRKQADYHKNIFQKELSETALAQQLRQHPGETFVDYQFYSVADEPSAFIVEPVVSDGVLEGWFALRCAINKINTMFTQEERLGATGEVFLVNKQHYMLTDSRFIGESSILKINLSRENIESKFQERAGHKIVNDYRGVRALTSFEVLLVDNSEWLLIAKIDEAEVITAQYVHHRETVSPCLIERLQTEAPRDCGALSLTSTPTVVDMDEFRKVSNKERLCTYGVSTCTAVIVSYPGKFSYMSHISRMDRIYGGNTTDLIGRMFKQIKTFDIYPYELRELRVTVVANHLDTILAVIDRLTAEGMFLSQIKLMYHPGAQYANVLHDYLDNRTFAVWLLNRETGDSCRQCSLDVKSMDDFFKPIIGYGQTPEPCQSTPLSDNRS